MADQSPALRPDWARDAVFYHIFPDRFCCTADHPASQMLQTWGSPPDRSSFFGGTLSGIRSKLNYLQDLGVNALLLTPIFRADTPHRYDTCSYLDIDPLLGTSGDFQALVDDLHGSGMHIVLDGVFNHTGTCFHAFQNLISHGEQSPCRNWYFVRGLPIEQDPPSYLTCGGAAFLPKLNTDSREVRDHLFHAARYWIEEFGIDGWRLDSACKVSMQFWHEFRTSLKQNFPDICLLGEIWESTRPWSDGSTFDGVTHYRLRDLIFKYAFHDLDSEDFAFDLLQLLDDAGMAAPWNLNLLGSHDTPRMWREASGNLDRLRIALVLQMTLPGIPVVYYGDEIGLDGGPDPDNRRCMPWCPETWNESMLSLYRTLIGFRRIEPALSLGSIEIVEASDHMLIFRRSFQNRQALVVLNTRGTQTNVKIQTAVEEPLKDIFSGHCLPSGRDKYILDNIQPWTARIYQQAS